MDVDVTTITATRIPGAYRIVPEPHPDRRGRFFEHLRTSELNAAIGHPFPVGQVNYSVSRRNTVRGIHATTLPPGQAKLVTCVRGAAMDVVVDLRVGSPTFGEYEITEQDQDSQIGVYIADGLGHAFVARTDDACMSYLCSAAYVPGSMIEVDPFDPDIGIPWNLTAEAVMSDKDAAAPPLADVVASGRLPTYKECLAHYDRLASRQTDLV